jgi:hypothetical protein
VFVCLPGSMSRCKSWGGSSVFEWLCCEALWLLILEIHRRDKSVVVQQVLSASLSDRPIVNRVAKEVAEVPHCRADGYGFLGAFGYSRAI